MNSGRNYGQIDKQMDVRTDDPIPRRPRQTFQARGIINIMFLMSYILTTSYPRGHVMSNIWCER